MTSVKHHKVLHPDPDNFAIIGAPEKHTGCLKKTGISVFDYLKSTIIVQKLHVGVVLEWF